MNTVKLFARVIFRARSQIGFQITSAHKRGPYGEGWPSNIIKATTRQAWRPRSRSVVGVINESLRLCDCHCASVAIGFGFFLTHKAMVARPWRRRRTRVTCSFTDRALVRSIVLLGRFISALLFTAFHPFPVRLLARPMRFYAHCWM